MSIAITQFSEREIYTMETNTSRNKPLKMHLLELTSLMVKVKRSRMELPNSAYNFTLDSALMAAIKRCEKDETALLSMDYPLLEPSMLHGIMGLKAYMLNLFYENTFLDEYDKSEIEWLYNAHCDKTGKNSDSSVFNVFTVVYLNALFCDYLKKDYGTLKLTPEDCKLAQSLLGVLSDDDRYEILFGCARHFTYGSIAYNNKAFEKHFPAILSAIKHKALEKLLVIDK